VEEVVFTTITVAMNERAVLLRGGLPVRALLPGRHTFWFGAVDALKWSTDPLVFTAHPAVLEILPTDWYDVVRIGPTERGVVSRDERPVLFLAPGVHRLWKVDGVKLAVLSVTEPVPELTDALRAILPAGEVLETTVYQHQRGLQYVDGKFVGVLGPGIYRFWQRAGPRVAVTVVDHRVQQLTVAGQELMTRDKVTLRLTLTLEYAPSDLPATVHSVADLQGALYLAVQLAARDFVAGVTLDGLLESRDALANHLEQQVVPRAKAFGVDVSRVGVKDVILPGEIRELVNKVVEAERTAKANLIRRQEETAATRSLLNTAKLMCIS
jgi:regulator of protease activity HflC (stomatin/prohibitin superfamily)